MSRNKIILLNKANDIMKILSEEYKILNLEINNYSVEIEIPETTIMGYNCWEKVIKKCIDKNITWRIRFNNTKLTFIISI